MSESKNMLVYFGAAGSGRAYCQHTGQNPDFFVDNDKNKWGTHVNEIEVKSPDVLVATPIERIVITSGYIKDILPQILSMGIGRDKIQVPPKSLLGFHIFTQKNTRIQTAGKLHEINTALGSQWCVVGVGGTALGFVRDHDFIHWDNDIDLFAPIQAKPQLLDILDRLGYSPEEESGAFMKSIKATVFLGKGIEIPLAIDFFDAEADTFIDKYEDYSWEWPTRMFTQCAKIEVHGKPMNVPNPPEEYLGRVFGSSWSKPNPQFGHSDYAGKES